MGNRMPLRSDEAPSARQKPSNPMSSASTAMNRGMPLRPWCSDVSRRSSRAANQSRSSASRSQRRTWSRTRLAPEPVYFSCQIRSRRLGEFAEFCSAAAASAPTAWVCCGTATLNHSSTAAPRTPINSAARGTACRVRSKSMRFGAIAGNRTRNGATTRSFRRSSSPRFSFSAPSSWTKTLWLEVTRTRRPPAVRTWKSFSCSGWRITPLMRRKRTSWSSSPKHRTSPRFAPVSLSTSPEGSCDTNASSMKPPMRTMRTPWRSSRTKTCSSPSTLMMMMR